MKQIDKTSLLLVAGAALFIILFGIGGVPLLDPDEPVYAETAKEMLQTGDFLSPRIFGDYWYDKPPMYYWLVAIAQAIFGTCEFAARLPAALMACATSVMVYVGATRLFSERAGFWSAMVLTSCVEFFYMGKAAVTDTTAKRPLRAVRSLPRVVMGLPVLAAVPVTRTPSAVTAM